MSDYSVEFLSALKEAAEAMGKAQEAISKANTSAMTYEFGRVTLYLDGEPVALLIPADWDEFEYMVSVPYKGNEDA